MSIRALHKNIFDLIESIDDCLKDCRILPALTLLYTGIDVVASLERKPNETVRDAFIRWTDDYLLGDQALPCTALDLYAARCGILHTFSPESDLLKKGQVRRILYAWGTACVDDLRQTIKLLGRSDIALHISALKIAFRNAVAAYLQELEKDKTRGQHVEAEASLWLSNMDPEILEAFLNRAKARRTARA
jgi:hypothetical protein